MLYSDIKIYLEDLILSCYSDPEFAPCTSLKPYGDLGFRPIGPSSVVQALWPRSYCVLTMALCCGFQGEARVGATLLGRTWQTGSRAVRH